MKPLALVVLLAAGVARADAPNLTELSFGELTRRATLLELERPWAATPVLLLVGGGLLTTAGLALGVIGIMCIVAALSDPWWSGLYAGVAAFSLVTGAGVTAGGLGMVLAATEKLRQRAMAKEELTEIRMLQRLPMPVAVPMTPVLMF